MGIRRFFNRLFGRKAEWVMYDPFYPKGDEWFECSNCAYEPELTEFYPVEGKGVTLHGYVLYDRCPRCGAKMTEPDEDVWFVDENDIIYED